MRRVRLRAQAARELKEARAWYGSQAAGLELEFARTVDAMIDLIARMPDAFPPLSAGVRHAVLRRFPYSLLFAVERDEIVILTAHHHARRPTEWHDSLNSR